MRAITIIILLVVLTQQAFAQVKTEETEIIENSTNFVLSEIDNNKKIKTDYLKKRQEAFDANKELFVKKLIVPNYPIVKNNKLSPSGHLIACISLKGKKKYLTVLNVASGEVIHQMELGGFQHDYKLVFSEDDALLYISQVDLIFRNLYVKTINLKTKEEIQFEKARIKGFSKKSSYVGISRRVHFTASKDSIHFYANNTNELIGSYKYGEMDIFFRSIQFSPSGQYVVLAFHQKPNTLFKYEIRKTSDFSLVADLVKDVPFPEKKYWQPSFDFNQEETKILIHTGNKKAFNYVESEILFDISRLKVIHQWDLFSEKYSYSTIVGNYVVKRQVWSKTRDYTSTIIDVNSLDEVLTFYGNYHSVSQSNLFACSGFSYERRNEVLIYDLSKQLHLKSFDQLEGLRAMFSDKFMLVMEDDVLNLLMPFEQQLMSSLEKTPKTLPKDEYETTETFNNRSKESKKGVYQLIIKEWETHYGKNAANEITIKLDSVGGYNADKQECKIYVLGSATTVSIPLQKAKEFKENLWKDAKVTGKVVYKGENRVPLITDLQIATGEDVYAIELIQQPLIELFRQYVLLDRE